MSQIVLYFLHSISVLSYYINVVLTLTIKNCGLQVALFLVVSFFLVVNLILHNENYMNISTNYHPKKLTRIHALITEA